MSVCEVMAPGMNFRPLSVTILSTTPSRLDPLLAVVGADRLEVVDVDTVVVDDFRFVCILKNLDAVSTEPLAARDMARCHTAAGSVRSSSVS